MNLLGSLFSDSAGAYTLSVKIRNNISIKNGTQYSNLKSERE
jgi:hypothetical protein